MYSKDKLSLNAGQNHSAIHLTFIKLPFVIKIFVLSIFEWMFYTGFTVQTLCLKTFSDSENISHMIPL